MVTGNEGEQIPYETAVQWIENFKKDFPNELYACLYGKTNIATLMSQQGTMGLRIYNALDPEGNKKLILFAVDQNGNGLESYVLEYGTWCPPNCGRP